jgi:hypothetical protein
MKMLEMRRLRKGNWKRKRQVCLLNKAWNETNLWAVLQGLAAKCGTAEPASNC